MTYESQTAGSWLATDGKWYPPETAPGYQTPSPRGQAPTAVPESAASHPQDDAGLLIVGDGINGPLFEFRASRFAGGRMITPNVVRIWPDRVEEYEHHAVLRTNTKAINFAQVSRVVLSRGLRWTNIQVESTGGHVIRLAGVPKDKADHVKSILDEKVHNAKVGTYEDVSPVVQTTLDLPDQLRKLAELRDQGILTGDEFASQKARLLR